LIWIKVETILSQNFLHKAGIRRYHLVLT